MSGSGLPLTGERTLPGVPAENYWFRRHVAAYRFAARHARGTIVDAGCGEGYGAALLARRGDGLGLDLDASAVVHAARTYRRARFARADLCRAPLRPGSVDAVVALQVLEHLACPDDLLERCRDALHPRGVLVISTPNRDTFPAGLNPFHPHEYVASELRALLERSFERVEVLGVHHRARLAAVERVLGEPVPHRLVRTPYPALPAWLRAALRTVTARDFEVRASAESALDLVAVASGA